MTEPNNIWIFINDVTLSFSIKKAIKDYLLNFYTQDEFSIEVFQDWTTLINKYQKNKDHKEKRPTVLILDPLGFEEDVLPFIKDLFQENRELFEYTHLVTAESFGRLEPLFKSFGILMPTYSLKGQWESEQKSLLEGLFPNTLENDFDWSPKGPFAKRNLVAIKKSFEDIESYYYGEEGHENFDLAIHLQKLCDLMEPVHYPPLQKEIEKVRDYFSKNAKPPRAKWRRMIKDLIDDSQPIINAMMAKL